MKGWQFRWFTLDPDSGLLEYYVVRIRVTQFTKMADSSACTIELWMYMGGWPSMKEA